MENQKDLWDKLKISSTIIAATLVPIIIVIVGNWYTTAIKNSENNLKYTELAIRILSEAPNKNNQNMRNWAIDLINNYSGVDINPLTRDEMINNPILDWDKISPGYVYPDIDTNERAVKFMVREIYDDSDPNYFLSNGYISYADEDWYVGFSSAGRRKENIILTGYNFVADSVEIRVEEYDYKMNVIVDSVYWGIIKNGYMIFEYTTKEITVPVKNGG
jgi:hypothetical protein